jgi:hypothetical protein
MEESIRHTRRCGSLSRRALRIFSALGVCLGWAAPAWCDELHIAKGVIEGRVIEETRHLIRIETASGEVTVPTNVITRRVEGPSRLQRYAEMRDQTTLTSQRHLELAAWCRSVQLDSLERHHVEAALAADPQNPDALRAAGYVRLGDVWLKAGLETREAKPDDTAAAIVDKLLSGWHQLVRTIRDYRFSSGAEPRSFAIGQMRLLGLREPLAIPAACRVLGDGNDRARLALAEMLGSYEQDAAALNLLVMALLDESEDVRQAANTQLTRRRDRRVVLFLRRALRCEVETIVQRAVDSLIRLGDVSAVEDLVEILPMSGFLGRQITADALFNQLQPIFAKPTLVRVGNTPFEYPASIALGSFARKAEDVVNESRPPVGAFRSYVQDALIAITGENYGFDIAAWHDWIARNLPSGQPAP